MLRRMQITNPGDTSYILGEQVERSELLGRNDKMLAAGKLPACEFVRPTVFSSPRD